MAAATPWPGPLEKKNELVRAHPDFQLVISFNPGYQAALKDLKPSTRQPKADTSGSAGSFLKPGWPRLSAVRAPCGVAPEVCWPGGAVAESRNAVGGAVHGQHYRR